MGVSRKFISANIIHGMRYRRKDLSDTTDLYEISRVFSFEPSFSFRTRRKDNKPIPLHTASTIAPMNRVEKLTIRPMKRMQRPDAKNAIPASQPLFSTALRSPKYARQEGKPNPKENPKREENSKMYVILNVSRIGIISDAIIPVNIQTARNVPRLENLFTKAVPNIAKTIAVAN